MTDNLLNRKSVRVSTLYGMLLAACLIVPYFGNYELTFVVWCLTVLVTAQRYYAIGFLAFTSCFAAILFLGFFSADYQNLKVFYYIRDITYLIKPVLGLLIGYQITKNLGQQVLKKLIFVAFLIAVAHLFLMVFSVVYYKVRNIHDLRLFSGYFSDFEVYAVVLLLFRKQLGIELTQREYRIGLIVISTSAFFYLARTHFIQFFILVLAMKGYLVLNKRSVMAVLSLVVVAVISYSAILYINPKRNGQGMEAFLYKIKVAPTEPFKRKINKDDYVDFNDNYRSVELNLTLRQVAYEGWPTILFGKGLGSQVDLKREVFLGDMELRYISVLHNAFMTVLLKAGVLGILIVLYSIYLLVRKSGSPNPRTRYISYLIVGTGVFMLASNWVLMGFYFTHDVKSIVVGVLFALRESAVKQTLEHDRSGHDLIEDQ
jgi:hypothetical protein